MKKKTRERLIDAYNRVFLEPPVRLEPYFPVLCGPRNIGWLCNKEDIETLLPLFKFEYSSKYECGDIDFEIEIVEQLRPAIITIGEKKIIAPASSIGDAELWQYRIRILIEKVCMIISEKDWQKITEDAVTDIPEYKEQTEAGKYSGAGFEKGSPVYQF